MCSDLGYGMPTDEMVDVVVKWLAGASNVVRRTIIAPPIKPICTLFAHCNDTEVICQGQVRSNIHHQAPVAGVVYFNSASSEGGP